MPWVSLACGRLKDCVDFSLSSRVENPGPRIMKRLVPGPRRVNYTRFLTPRPSLIHLFSHSIVITEPAICQAGAGLGTSEGDSDKVKCPAASPLVGETFNLQTDSAKRCPVLYGEGLGPAGAAHSSRKSSGHSVPETESP